MTREEYRVMLGRAFPTPFLFFFSKIHARSTVVLGHSMAAGKHGTAPGQCIKLATVRPNVIFFWSSQVVHTLQSIDKQKKAGGSGDVEMCIQRPPSLRCESHHAPCPRATPHPPPPPPGGIGRLYAAYLNNFFQPPHRHATWERLEQRE
uniref:Uncharacterized protein n=1 Tax=Eutreptiella gymnastica TaxID=73025 RepID=A0A7S4D1J4_9EUGL|mmetsp:Transcript_31053/g.50295  ORF Transcript_31053/g.50295 Transcript_31053/m.50295 type:complete len:149 (+) Transcript_31053:210-656(+)